jgi:hypothetical protein
VAWLRVVTGAAATERPSLRNQGLIVEKTLAPASSQVSHEPEKTSRDPVRVSKRAR